MNLRTTEDWMKEVDFISDFYWEEDFKNIIKNIRIELLDYISQLEEKSFEKFENFDRFDGAIGPNKLPINELKNKILLGKTI